MACFWQFLVYVNDSLNEMKVILSGENVELEVAKIPGEFQHFYIVLFKDSY